MDNVININNLLIFIKLTIENDVLFLYFRLPF
jgi:hypothetical protein